MKKREQREDGEMEKREIGRAEGETEKVKQREEGDSVKSEDREKGESNEREKQESQ